ncbi:Fph type histidine kinase [Butyriboletus roseoflavus]|nr:Fph type histidine kinase [Butyriboletus roseoflavus]
MSHPRHRAPPTPYVLLPGEISHCISIPFSGMLWNFSADARSLAESLLLLGSLYYANRKLALAFGPLHTPGSSPSSEIDILIVTCIIYLIWSHSSFVKKAPIPPPDVADVRAPSPRIDRDSRRGGSLRSSQNRAHFGFVWMSVPKNFRDCPDDGVLTGLSFAPLISIALLFSSLHQTASPNPGVLLPDWLIEAPRILQHARAPLSVLDALILSRRSLVDYATLCSFILLIQIFSSSWYEARYRRGRNVPEGERGSVPRSEARRTWTYWIYSYVLTLVALFVRHLFASNNINLWHNLSYFDIIVGSVFFQFCLYIALRLAHGGFTLGELALVCFGGVSLGTELLNLTRAQLWPKRTPFIKTYRLPGPLLILQVALIAGSLLTGFLLSPLLALSRHIAQRPVRRLRFPHEKPRHRRALAAGFYVGTIVIVAGLIGSWTWLCLGKRDPWLWVIFWILQGKKKWTRPLLLGYWALLGSISVAGWNRQLSRSRRYKPRNAASNMGDNGMHSTPTVQTQKSAEPVTPATSPTAGLGLAFANLPNLPNLPNGTQVATDLLDAADKHVPTLSINARRKFFHALAVVMFLPGVAVDPAFTHLSFSAAFALFIFAEYVRYFAIYPFGAAVHLFMNEFLDQKDRGTAILSHFYLLTGCAGSVWLEGPSRILMYTGILALGVGDALASIVGKRIGKHRWSASSSKTIEGSTAFAVSVVGCAWVLRVVGLTERFSMTRYGVVAVLSSLLEALSEQNDNLTLPLYMWSILVVIMSAPPSSLSPPSQPPFLFSTIRPSRCPSSSSQTLPSAFADPPDPLPPPFSTAPLFSSPALPFLQIKTSSYVVLLSLASPHPNPFQNTPPPRTDGDVSNYASRCDTINDGSAHATDARSQATLSDYDWVSFITAYAAGQWNPHRTPHPPRSVFDPTWFSVQSQPPDLTASTSPNKSWQSGASSSEYLLPGHPVSLSPSSELANEKESKNQLTVSPEKHFSKLPPPPASLIVRRFRKSFNDIRQTTGHTMQLSLDGAQSLAMAPDATTAAATMRWAAARVNISPLALPSPEHELTDPMRGVHAAIPGAHAPECSPPLNPGTPGNNRKTRLGSFWEGTQDVGDDTDRLSTIHGSNPASPTHSTIDGDVRPLADSSWNAFLTSASVPLPRRSPEEHPEEDYFTASSSRANTVDTDPRISPDVPSIWQEYVNVQRDNESLDVNMSTIPRRTCLTRQTSSPLPISTASKLPGGRSVSETVSSYRIGRAAKEEQMFLELGYLAPPNPPDELERRRALYKFNIWNTAPDINFDRIAHLVKLVFNTKSVYISLVDGTEQWFKSQCGTSFTRCPRLTSFCAHSILQRCDEPTVILDTLADWRFAKNPFVTGNPHTRFYAGAPLRTQEGYNIGSLALIDDSPRQDFSPRQRHTLKEFAAVVMREMELWRDKIQLRIRDKIQTSMEHFSRECLEIDQQESQNVDMYASASMDKVYDRAAKLVKRTLDVEEVLVMDVSHCEVLETLNAEATVSVVMHHGNAQTRATSRTLTADEQSKLNTFFEQFPDGKISEGILPVCFRPFIPTHIQYALTVPVFNIDKRPFALICAYNASDPSRRFLEGHELSYLRAIGVIILSAVLKRRMMLADQAKSLFISNISHELRTPLHGILAAAELLADTQLNHGQTSFLHTVQACGTSLVETVNHVLDFTKLSGNMKSGGVENVISRTRVDLEQLVEEAIDGSWIGYCARNSSRGSEIGSVYAPNLNQRASSVMTAPESSQNVEIVVNIDHREGGWILKCDKGGIRRVLMNVFGNSLKFTSNGYIHVSLRQLSAPEDVVNDMVKIELCVSDTGKGISQNFLKNHLFHPFSQENPLQAGTGLGLAIVSSIVRSPSIAGKVEVLSEENVGTDIKVVFEAEIPAEGSSNIQDPFFFDDQMRPPVISFLGFKKRGHGTQLLSEVLHKYLITWWGFTPQREGAELGDIIILNEDPSPIVTALEKMDNHRSFIILTSSRGSPRVMGICNAYETNGGFCRVVHKPGGPFRLRTALKQLLRAKQRRQHRTPSFTNSGMSTEDSVSLHSTIFADEFSESAAEKHRRGSIDNWRDQPTLLATGISGVTVAISPDSEKDIIFQPTDGEQTVTFPCISNSALAVGADGNLLKASVGPVESTKLRRKVLVVEDNSILRSLLGKWLSKKGFEYCEAVDGRQGVEIFQNEGPFDVVLLDLSMPVLDGVFISSIGVGATVEIRQIERAGSSQQSSVILALTGMSSLEDKRKAFEAGMDG